MTEKNLLALASAFTDEAEAMVKAWRIEVEDHPRSALTGGVPMLSDMQADSARLLTELLASLSGLSCEGLRHVLRVGIAHANKTAAFAAALAKAAGEV